MTWCMDTSALVEPWVRLYPPDVFPPVWTALEAMAREGRLFAPLEVKLELERQKDDLYEWACGLDGFFIEPDREQVELQKEIVNAHPGLIKENSTKSAGDPWVIALAQIRRVPVVAYETRAKQNAFPKIPNVCDARGIEVVMLVDVLRARGIRL